MQTIDVLFIPRESLEDTNKLILEYGGTPLECVTLIKAPYVERENGPGVWMKALQENNYTWIFHGSAGRGHVNVPRDLKGSPFWNEQADVRRRRAEASGLLPGERWPALLPDEDPQAADVVGPRVHVRGAQRSAVPLQQDH